MAKNLQNGNMDIPTILVTKDVYMAIKAIPSVLKYRITIMIK